MADRAFLDDEPAAELVEAIAWVMRDHGTAELYRPDEFDCCAEEIAQLFEPAGVGVYRLRVAAKAGPRRVTVWEATARRLAQFARHVVDGG